MNLDLLQVILILWLIERVSIERRRYKIALDNNGGYKKGYWSIWVYCKNKGEDRYVRNGGKRIIHFTKYIIPHIS